MSYFLVLQTRPDNRASQASVSIAWAVLALALFLLWQFLTVHYNRGGNWNALFLTGDRYAIPPDLAPTTYKFPGHGFDGEMYRYVARDLFMRNGYVKYVDGPAQRYHRILVPALAYLLVGGINPGSTRRISRWSRYSPCSARTGLADGPCQWAATPRGHWRSYWFQLL